MKSPFHQLASFRRLFILVLLLFYSAFHIPPSAFAAARSTPTPAPEAEWDAGLGLTTYGAEIKSGCWYPVWVEIRATKAPVRGRVTITQPGNPLIVEIPVDAAKGSRKIYRASFRPFVMSVSGYVSSSFDLEFKLEAEPIGTATIPLNLRFARQGDQHVLILCEQAGSFNFLNRLGGARDEQQSRAAILGRRAVLYGKPELLPDDPAALQSLDAMIIDTPEVRRLDSAQWAAIRGWVARGGRLLLASGRQQPFIQQSELKDPFGVRLRAPEPTTSFTLDRSPVLAAWPEPSATPWDQVWCGSASQPFLAGRRVGQGWFNFCAAALDKPVTDALLQTSNNELYQPLEALLGQEPSVPSPLLVFAASSERSLGLSLQRGFAVTLADIGWVILYLLAYNLIAMPLNWWLCRRFGRPAWSWPLLVLLAVLFAWYGYRSGMERQQKNFQVNELTFISRPLPDAPAQAVAYTTLFTPRRITGDLPAAGRDYLTPLPLSEREVPNPLTVGFDPVTTVRNVLIFPWTVLNLRGEFSPPASDGLVELDHAISVKDRSINADLGPLTLTNKTGYTFQHWWLRYDNMLWTGPKPLEPGKPVTFPQFKLDPAGTPLSSLVWPLIETAFPSGNPARHEETFMVAQDGSSTPPSDYGKLYFLGQANDVGSPFAKSFIGQRSLGCLFYEQPLPLRFEQPPSARAADDLQYAAADNIWRPGPWTWKVTVIDRIPTNPGDQYFLSHQGSTGLCFPLNTVVLEVAPKKVREPGQRIPPSATLSFQFASYPNPTTVWTNTSNGLSYQMDSCPVEVYNFRTKSWEPRGVEKMTRLTLSPLSDYLHPTASAIVLRLRAEPDNIRYRLMPPRAGYPPVLPSSDITGRELFTSKYGVQLPVTLQEMLDRLRSGSGDTSPWDPPYSAQIIDLGNTLHAISPRAAARP